MKKQLLYLISSTVIFWSFSGCATTARYSPEEIKDYPPEIQEHIKSGEVTLGMTTLQVRYAWGAPATVNVITPENGGKIKEEWIYSRMGIFKTRLIFTEGKLTEIISTEPGLTK